MFLSLCCFVHESRRPLKSLPSQCFAHSPLAASQWTLDASMSSGVQRGSGLGPRVPCPPQTPYSTQDGRFSARTPAPSGSGTLAVVVFPSVRPSWPPPTYFSSQCRHHVFQGVLLDQSWSGDTVINSRTSWPHSDYVRHLLHYLHICLDRTPCRTEPKWQRPRSTQQSSHRTRFPHSLLNEQINVCAARSLVYCGTFSNGRLVSLTIPLQQPFQLETAETAAVGRNRCHPGVWL